MPCCGSPAAAPSPPITSAEVAEAEETPGDRFKVTIGDREAKFPTYADAQQYRAAHGGQLSTV